MAAAAPVDQPVHPLLVDLNRKLWATVPVDEATDTSLAHPGHQPVSNLPGITVRLFMRLCRWWDEHPRTTTFRRDFTLVELMCNDISRENFSRTRGVGKTTLTELENLLHSAGYRLP